MRHGALNGAARGLLMAGLALAVAACSDGYPSEDAPAFEPNSMNLAQRTAWMNKLGGQASSHRTWRYQFETPCRLNVSASALLERKQSFTVPLAGLTVDLKTDADTKAHGVWLRNEATPDAPPLAVYESARRVSAMQMQVLLQQAQRDCHPAGQG